MAHEHSVFNTDERFTIDIDSRTITQQSGKTKLMQFDHNSERYEFEISRYIDGHDMSLCNDIKVNYLNVSSNRSGQTNGSYVVTDMRVDPSNDEKIVFSWLISRNSTKYAGTLNFNISFRCLVGAVVNYAWHTDIFRGITVSSSIENSGNEYVEEYIDILEQWKQSVLENIEIGAGTVNSVNGIGPDATGNVLIEFPESTIRKIDSFDENALVNLRDLESGTYILDGYFKPYSGSDDTMHFSSNIAVQIMRGAQESHIQICYPTDNCIQWIKITDTEYEQSNTYLNDLASRTYVDERIVGLESDSKGAVRFDQVQDLSNVEKEQARVNIGLEEFIVDSLITLDMLPVIMEEDGTMLADGDGAILLNESDSKSAVRFDQVQDLSNVEKEQARANLGLEEFILDSLITLNVLPVIMEEDGTMLADGDGVILLNV